MVKCAECPRCRKFGSFGIHYCESLGEWGKMPILIVDYWLDSGSVPVFCPQKFPQVVEGWRGATQE